MFIDTHAHLTHPRYKAHERIDVINSLEADGSIVINSSISFKTNFSMMEKLIEFQNIYFSCGIHPNSVAFYDMDLFSKTIHDQLQQLKSFILTHKDKVVAVGECGLDTSRIIASPLSENAPKINSEIFFKNQVELFMAQLNLAVELSLPVVLHLRNAESKTFNENKYDLPVDVIDCTLNFLNHENYKTITGVVHCFNGNLQNATNLINHGFFLGIGGTITRSDELRDIIRQLSLDYIVLETDSPFLAPAGFVSAKNTPVSIPIIAAEIAELKGIAAREVLEITAQNAKKLFKLKGI